MSNQLKRTMKLMWGCKVYRKAFGVHPVVFGVYILCAVLFGGYPLVSALVKEELTVRMSVVSTLIPAVFFLYFSAYFGNQFSAMFASGKSLLSFPVAKQALTSGIAINRLIVCIIAMLPAVAMRLLSVGMGYGTVTMVDDMLIAFGVAYMIAMLMSASIWLWVGFIWFFAIVAITSAFKIPIGKGVADRLADVMYNYRIPFWLVGLILVGMLLLGTLLGWWLLRRGYRERKAVYNQIELRMQPKKKK